MKTIVIATWLYYGLWLLLIMGILAIGVIAFLVWRLRHVDFRICW